MEVRQPEDGEKTTGQAKREENECTEINIKEEEDDRRREKRKECDKRGVDKDSEEILIFVQTQLTCTVTEGTGRPSISWIRAFCRETKRIYLPLDCLCMCLWLLMCKGVHVLCVYRLAVHARGHGSCNDQVLLSITFRQNVYMKRGRCLTQNIF